MRQPTRPEKAYDELIHCLWMAMDNDWKPAEDIRHVFNEAFRRRLKKAGVIIAFRKDVVDDLPP